MGKGAYFIQVRKEERKKDDEQNCHFQVWSLSNLIKLSETIRVDLAIE